MTDDAPAKFVQIAVPREGPQLFALDEKGLIWYSEDGSPGILGGPATPPGWRPISNHRRATTKDSGNG